MQVVPAEEEVDAEVRREDQDNINRFARLNARLHELRAERELIEVSLPTPIMNQLSFITMT
jgi:prefoldin subunit 4